VSLRYILQNVGYTAFFESILLLLFTLQYADKYEQEELTDFLERIEQKLDYKMWFSGHYHRDKAIDGNERIRLIYNDLIPIE